MPLIESGTTGFNGQVQVIKKSRTACYDCTEKEIPKSYPVCTIRSTPSQPIHCIVWAKSYLLPELFGRSEDEESEQVDTSENSDNAEEIKNLKAEAQALKKIREDMNGDDFAQKVFDKVFKDDIDRLRGMEDMWKTRSPPISLDFSTLQAETTTTTTSPSDQNPWSLTENVSVFVSSLHRLRTRFQDSLKTASSSNSDPFITFDKDDPETLDFVTSASNLRSHIFSIDPLSKFTVKQMAGNIIPAIATTNAMTAGLCVMQSFKVLRGDLKRAKMLFLETSGARVINSEPPREPAPECAVCSVATAELEVDFSRAKLGDLVEGVLRKIGGYGEEMTVMNDLGPIYDPDMEDMLEKTFDDLGIKDGGFLTVIDDDGDPRVNLVLAISNKTIDTNPPIRLVQAPSNTESGVSNGAADPAHPESAARLVVPRKPKQASPEENGAANGSANATKAKRTAQEAGLDSIADLKRRVKEHSLGKDDQDDIRSQKQKQNHDSQGVTVILDDDDEVDASGGGGGVLNGNGAVPNNGVGAAVKDGSIIIEDD